MPKFLEDRLKAQAANKGLNEKQSMRYVFGALNNMNAMHGNVETPKGRAMDAKHARDMKAASPAKAKRADGSSYPHSNLGKYLHPKKGKRPSPPRGPCRCGCAVVSLALSLSMP